MIPLYVQTTLGGATGIPAKNPIYFIRKAIQRLPTTRYDLIVLNTDENPTSAVYTPTGLITLDSYQLNGILDVELVSVQNVYDIQLDPNPDTDGSIAGPPSLKHRIVTMAGFIKSNSLHYTQGVAELMNMAFDPVRNYLEGASYMDNTILPHWQPFYNIGYGILAWYDDTSGSDWREDNTWQDTVTDPFDLEPYARLNRFMFVRSIAKPVIRSGSKFHDYAVPFTVRLMAVDPTIYEFLPPTEFFDGTSEQVTIDEEHGGDIISHITAGGQYSDEAFVRPTTVLWGHDGPGYREVTSTEAPDLDHVTSPGGTTTLSATLATGDAAFVIVGGTFVADADADAVTVEWQPAFLNSSNQGTSYALTKIHESSDSDGQRVMIFAINGAVASSEATSRFKVELGGQCFGAMLSYRVIEGGVSSITPVDTGTGTGSGTTATAPATVADGNLLIFGAVIHTGNTTPPAVTFTNLPINIDDQTNQVFSQMRHAAGIGISGSPSVSWSGTFTWKAASVVIAGAA